MKSFFSNLTVASLLLFGYSSPCLSQTPAAKPQPDILTLVDGETLIGHLKKSSGTSLTFKSDLAGEVTVDWSKVKALQSAQKFAVINKDLKLRPGQETAVPEGSITVADQNLQVHTGQTPAEVTVPVKELGEVIGEADFNQAIERAPGFFEDWKGSATVGVAFVQATQNSQSYTSAISLVRAIPAESWLLPVNRTSLNFTSTYGELSQPNTPTVKTSLFNGEAERDHYFRPTLYAFGNAGFGHDYSQGLDLQQTYGGGIGWTVLKSPVRELDLKGELNYVDQQFTVASNNQKLLGSIFSESYNHTFGKKIILHEAVNLAPAWTVLRDYSANATVSLAIPVFKRMSFTITTADQFLNDPPAGFKKNSYQLSTGVTYTMP